MDDNTFFQLGLDASELSKMIGGLYVLNSASEDPGAILKTKLAREAIGPTIDAIMAKSEKLEDDIEKAQVALYRDGKGAA